MILTDVRFQPNDGEICNRIESASIVTYLRWIYIFVRIVRCLKRNNYLPDEQSCFAEITIPWDTRRGELEGLLEEQITEAAPIANG